VENSNQKKPVQRARPEETRPAVVNGIPLEPLLTPAEAGEYLRVHPKTAIRMAREGELPGLRVGQKHWRFRRSDLVVWAASKVGSSCQPAE
jgi:excisionase family DNA binding protein